MKTKTKSGLMQLNTKIKTIQSYKYYL